MHENQYIEHLFVVDLSCQYTGVSEWLGLVGLEWAGLDYITWVPKEFPWVPPDSMITHGFHGYHCNPWALVVLKQAHPHISGLQSPSIIVLIPCRETLLQGR